MNEKVMHRFTPWLIWFMGALMFFVLYFPRVAPSVMEPELMHSFHIDGLGFGALTAFFLYAYVPMQIPVGMLVDHFGARRLLYSMCLLAGLGCILFATSHALWLAQIGRFLNGFGSAFGFVGALKLAKDWFPNERIGLLAGFTQALGMLGAAFGEEPVALAVNHWGWRPTMMVMGVCFWVLALLIFIIVRDKEKNIIAAHKEHFLSGLIKVMKQKQSWLNAFYLGLAYAPVMAFAEAWGVSFLQSAYALTKNSAAMVVGFIFFGWGVGGPIVGALSDAIRRRKPAMVLSGLIGASVFGVVLFSSQLSVPTLCVLMFIFGFSNTGVGVAYALSGEIVAPEIAGTSMAFANMASIVIGMLLEPIIGWILDMQGGELVDGVYHYSVHDYRVALLALPVGLLLSFVFAAWVKETRCQTVG